MIYLAEIDNRGDYTKEYIPIYRLVEASDSSEAEETVRRIHGVHTSCTIHETLNLRSI